MFHILCAPYQYISGVSWSRDKRLSVTMIQFKQIAIIHDFWFCLAHSYQDVLITSCNFICIPLRNGINCIINDIPTFFKMKPARKIIYKTYFNSLWLLSAHIIYKGWFFHTTTDEFHTSSSHTDCRRFNLNILTKEQKTESNFLCP